MEFAVYEDVVFTALLQHLNFLLLFDTVILCFLQLFEQVGLPGDFRLTQSTLCRSSKIILGLDSRLFAIRACKLVLKDGYLLNKRRVYFPNTTTLHLTHHTVQLIPELFVLVAQFCHILGEENVFLHDVAYFAVADEDILIL